MLQNKRYIFLYILKVAIKPLLTTCVPTNDGMFFRNSFDNTCIIKNNKNNGLE